MLLETVEDDLGFSGIREVVARVWIDTEQEVECALSRQRASLEAPVESGIYSPA